MKFQSIVRAVVLIVPVMLASVAIAQTYPAKSVRLVLPFAPSRWVVARAGEPAAHDTVVGGGASLGPFPSVEDPRGLEVVLMYPLAHVARMRVALALGDEWPERVSLADLPDPDAVARGWQTLLDRGTRVVLPEAPLTERVARARAAVLLDADGGADRVAALEDWGFDAEAEYAWHGLRLRDRRAAQIGRAHV